MTKEKLASIVNDSMLKASQVSDELELGIITKRLWKAIDKYVSVK